MMNKNLAIALTALALVTANAAPALADTKKGSATETVENTAMTVAMVPVRGAAFVTGAIIGTPIAVTRKVVQESVAATKTLAGDSANPAALAACSLVGIPVGVFVGGVEGLYYGTADSYYNSSDRPFGLDSFSLGDMGEEK